MLGSRMYGNMGVFQFCALESVKLPSTLKQIGCCCFTRCRNLVKIELSETLESIGDNCFGWTGLREFVAPPRLQAIGKAVFYGCKALTSAALNDGLLSVGAHAFSESGLERVQIPATVRKLGDLDAGDQGFSPAEIVEGQKEIGVECVKAPSEAQSV